VDVRRVRQIERGERIGRATLPRLAAAHRLERAPQLLHVVVGRQVDREVHADAERLANQRTGAARVAEARVHVVAEAARRGVEAARHEQHGIRLRRGAPAAHVVGAVHELIDPA
jgi:hypothetical protein